MEGIVTRYDEEFNGVIVDENGVNISVPGALEGERIRYRIEHKSPHQPKAWARCEQLYGASRERVQPPCPISWPVSGACAGCPLMHMNAKLQSRLKKEQVLNALNEAGILYIRDIKYHDAPDPLGYRNRTDLVVTERRGQIALGSYMIRSHEVVVMKSCPVLRSPLNQVINYFTSAANQLGIQAYRPMPQFAGALRYVSFFANDKLDVLIDIVCKSADGAKPAWLDALAAKLMEFSAVCGVSYSINDSPNNAIRVAPSTTLAGVSRIVEHHGSVESLFSPAGFTQLNSDVAAQIYQAARDWLGSTPRILWDLYCGAGAFGRTVRAVKALYGAEFSPSAIEAARQISQNDPYETHFEVVDLEKSWPNWPSPDVILLDPPRKGLSQLAIQKISSSLVPTVIYMSCNPESFAKNVAALNDTYVLERVEAFDMMPNTRHVEVLGLLRHR